MGVFSCSFLVASTKFILTVFEVQGVVIEMMVATAVVGVRVRGDKPSLGGAVCVFFRGYDVTWRGKGTVITRDAD